MHIDSILKGPYLYGDHNFYVVFLLLWILCIKGIFLATDLFLTLTITSLLNQRLLGKRLAAEATAYIIFYL